MASAVPRPLAAVAHTALALRRPAYRKALHAELALVPKALREGARLAWRRAHGRRVSTLLECALDNAWAAPDVLAVEMDDERMLWADLADESARVAHVLADAGVRAGDVVAVMGANSPLYLVAVLGIARLGATAALVNSHLERPGLVHALRVAQPRVVLVQQSLVANVRHIENEVGLRHVLTYGPGELERAMRQAPAREPPIARGEADFAYVYTSGTTGLPKLCRMPQTRAATIARLAGTLVCELAPGDKVYCALPLYHTSGLLIGAGACIVTRTPIALRPSFSTSGFWPDVQRYGATVMLYIGEICRYLVQAPLHPAERPNPLRLAVGSGLRSDVWRHFSQRFEIPLIREFYGATEAPGGIVNFTGRVGSVGHLPLRPALPVRLARYDVERDEHVRGTDGFCTECEAHETGELLIAFRRSAKGFTEFAGYTDTAATRSKILENVFRAGDRYYRSGDLLYFDDDDYFYFVDRIGDTFRYKGENVSTAEVEQVLRRVPGVCDVAVCGVMLPGIEGQAGLAAVVFEAEPDLDALWRGASELPAYARPRFVRIVKALALTGTFKIQKQRLRSDGIDPRAVGDAMYMCGNAGYVRFTEPLWKALRSGEIRL